MSQPSNSISEAVDSGHLVRIRHSDKHVRVEFGGQVIAESNNALVLEESSCADVYYFPIDDVRMEFLTPAATTSHCPYKGDATYWNIRTARKEMNDAAWSYRHPLKACAAIKGYIAFYADRMDRFVVKEKDK